MNTPEYIKMTEELIEAEENEEAKKILLTSIASYKKYYDVEVQLTKDDIFEAYRYMMFRYPLYAYFLGNCQIVIDNHYQSTFAVSFEHNNFNMKFNQHMKLRDPHINDTILPLVVMLIHEMSHIMLHHIDSCRFPDLNSIIERHERKEITAEEAYQVMKIHNIAMDLAINSIIIPYFSKKTSYINEFFIEPGKGNYKDFPPKLTTEEYLELLKQQKQEGKKGKSEEEFYCQDVKMSDGTNKEGKSSMNGKISSIIQKYMSKSWGTTSKFIDDMLKLYSNSLPRISWKQLLKMQVKRQLQRKSMEKRSTWTKRNKRHSFLPGRVKKNETFNLIFCIDQSGSMSNEEIAEAIPELQALSTLLSIHIVHFDTEISHTQQYKKGEKIEFITRTAEGGTDFNCCGEYADQNDMDMMVIYTDMGAPFPKLCKTRRVWVATTKDYNSSFDDDLVIPLLGEIK